MNLVLFRFTELSNDDDNDDENRQQYSLSLGAKDKRTKHILGHLRKTSGQEVSVGCIGGNQGKAIVQIITPEEQPNDNKKRQEPLQSLKLELQFHPTNPNTNETGTNPPVGQRPAYNVTLLLALPFPKVIKSLWSNVASMGIAKIIVVKGHLSDEDHGKSSALQEAVYLPLIEDGMSQGAHTFEPSVHVDIEKDVSKSLLEDLGLGSDVSTTTSTSTDDASSKNKNAIKLFLDCGNEETEPPPALAVILNHLQRQEQRQATASPQNHSSVVIAVGPERGWTDQEATTFEQAGFHSATLGGSILRVETAVIASLGIVCSALDMIAMDENNNTNTCMTELTCKNDTKAKPPNKKRKQGDA